VSQVSALSLVALTFLRSNGAVPEVLMPTNLAPSKVLPGMAKTHWDMKQRRRR
jgi:hypothetical protein